MLQSLIQSDIRLEHMGEGGEGGGGGGGSEAENGAIVVAFVNRLGLISR